MHTTIIDPVIRARYQALKGGREFAFTRIETHRTALLVIDMQNGFVEEGALLEVPAARGIVENINASTPFLSQEHCRTAAVARRLEMPSNWASRLFSSLTPMPH